MVKTIEVFLKKGEISKEDFIAKLKAHGEGAKAIKGIKGYIVNEVVPSPPRLDIAQFRIPLLDAIVETFYDDIEALRAVRDGDNMKAFLASRADFVGSMKTLLTLEHIIIDPGVENRPSVKNFAFLNRRPGMTLPEFLNEWIVLHGPMSLKVPHQGGFVPNEVLAVIPNSDGFDLIDTDYIEGVAVANFVSTETQALMRASDEAKEWFKHGGVTFGTVFGQSARETVIIAPKA